MDEIEERLKFVRWRKNKERIQNEAIIITSEYLWLKSDELKLKMIEEIHEEDRGKNGRQLNQMI